MFKCDYCHSIFSTKADVVKHLNDTHYKIKQVCDPRSFVSSTNSSNIDKNKSSNFTCAMCKKQFLSSDLLDDHVEKFHVQFKCQKCNKTFNNKLCLDEHIKSHPKVVPLAEIKEIMRRATRNIYLKKLATPAFKVFEKSPISAEAPQIIRQLAVAPIEIVKSVEAPKKVNTLNEAPQKADQLIASPQ
jgi:uncharacterized C2H2 Zn-finger protein